MEKTSQTVQRPDKEVTKYGTKTSVSPAEKLT